MIIYIAGKYQADTELGLVENIRHAEREALKLWALGWTVFCPHKNTAHFGGLLKDSTKDRELWLKGNLEILTKCRAIYMLSNWRQSEGAKAELALAQKLGLEVFYEQD